MDANAVRQTLCKVLQDIQSSSALGCPTLTGKIKQPIEELPEFDSKIWPVATALLAKALGVAIADDVNIFREDHTRRALSVDETVAVVLKVSKAVPSVSEQAELSE